MTPTLVLVNGPPASGKSTLATSFVAQRPLALNLDVDVVRGLLGQWKDAPLDAGLAARHLALAMAAAHLRSGRDVIVPQLVARPQFVDELAQTAAAAGARFVEIVLVLARTDAIEAFEQRSAAPTNTQQRDAYETLGGRDIGTMYDDLMRFVNARPATVRVPVERGDIDATLRRLEAAIAADRADQI